MNNSKTREILLVSYDSSSDSSKEDENVSKTKNVIEVPKENISRCTTTPNTYNIPNGKIVDLNENILLKKKLNEIESEEFPLPQICDNSIDGDSLFNDCNEFTELVQLNNLVRQKYRDYLIRLLTTNYKTCSKDNDEILFNNYDIKECAKYMELNAVKSSIVVNLYRKSMLKMISEIRNNTNNEKINNQLSEYKLNREKLYRNVDVQTDNEISTMIKPLEATVSSTLDDKIKLFEKHMEYETRKRKRQEYLYYAKKKREQKIKLSHPIQPIEVTSSSSVINEQNILPENLLSEDDTIMKEMEELFGSIDENENGVDLFGDGTIFVKENHPQTKEDEKVLPVNEIVIDREEKIKEILKSSLWPCELHYQLINLKNVMLGIADKGYRHHVKVQTKFIKLFGENQSSEDYENEDDLIGLYSPTIELNDVLLASCKKRIAPWIVKHLMKPFNNGLIADKYLFKRLAKHLSDKILYQDQHPDEKAIMLLIQNYFLEHPYIHYIEDIN